MEAAAKTQKFVTASRPRGAYRHKRDPLDPCPVELVLDIIAGKWKVRILLLLSLAPHTFAELRRRLPGIKQQVLATQLQALVADRIISHQRVATPAPGHSLYRLAPLGESLFPVLEAMADWGRDRLREQGIDWTPPCL